MQDATRGNVEEHGQFFVSVVILYIIQGMENPIRGFTGKYMEILEFYVISTDIDRPTVVVF